MGTYYTQCTWEDFCGLARSPIMYRILKRLQRGFSQARVFIHKNNTSPYRSTGGLLKLEKPTNYWLVHNACSKQYNLLFYNDLYILKLVGGKY